MSANPPLMDTKKLIAKAQQMCFLLGAWLCALGYVKAGLSFFLLGGMPDILKLDRFAILFGLSSVYGLCRIFKVF